VARTYSGLNVKGDQGGLFPWRSRYVDVGGGVRQAYVDEGAKDAPVTFVCLHGNPTWGFLYREFIRRLSEHNRVIVPDHVGFGRSDKPDDPAYYSLERHIRNLTEVLNKAKAERVVLVVQDWGGPIGMGWATRHPHKVAGLVVLNTWAFVRDPPMKLPLLFRLLVLGRGGWRRVVGGNFFVEAILAKRGTSRPLGEAELNAYRAPFPTPQERTGIGRFPQMIPQTRDRDHPDWGTMAAIEDHLPELADRPALLVWAQRDVAFRRRFLERWVGLLRNLDGPHILPDARHYLQEDAAPRILDLIEAWLPKVGGTAAAKPVARRPKPKSKPKTKPKPK
jgi:haloalkane dehalogenase